MEANGFQRRLQCAKDNSEKIKIIFQYPASPRAVIHKGEVLAVYDDCFDFKDCISGEMTFSFKFIAEIKNWGDGE